MMNEPLEDAHAHDLASTVEQFLTGEFRGHKLYGDPGDPHVLRELSGGEEPLARGVQARQIALTFDDGPSRTNTGPLLDFLAKERIRATFFVLGSLLETPAGRDLVRRAHSEGHLVGNHSHSHPDLTRLSRAAVELQLRRTHERIVAITGNCELFRPPYGALNSTVRSTASDMGYQIVLWTVDSLDWRHRSDRWLEISMTQIRARVNSIVLMHDIHSTTVSRVPELVRRIRALGEVEFVQV